MIVDQIKKNILCLFLGCLLPACEPHHQESEQSARKPKASALEAVSDDPEQAPPVPLKQIPNQGSPALKVLESLRSSDQSGHRRLQLFLEHSQPVAQSFYWQIIGLYRNQYDAIWIYVHAPGTKSGLWQARAAWFSPSLPRNLHLPGFKVQHRHDGLYWSQE